MMKVTGAHLGNVYLAVKALFQELNIEYIIPPMSNKLALEIGSFHSPEEMCLPYKIMIGNYLQAIEDGANTVIIPGSCGPCRFGEYCELQINLFEKLGHELNFIVLDSPGDIGIKELFKRVGKISSKSNKTTTKKVTALRDAIKVINLMDGIEAETRYKVGFEKNRGDFKRLLNQCKRDAINAKTSIEMIKILKEYKNEIKDIPIDDGKNPIKIAIIGEIYTIIEPFSNLFIEDKLMDMGVSTKRTLSPSWWIKDTVLKPIKLNSLRLKVAAKDYLPMGIGGHGRECVGEAILAHKKGFDGAIQIFPLGCMPEIVSKSILPSISKKLDFPIMSLVVDEMTGEAGYNTRIEAFIDLLERRRLNAFSRN